MASKSAKNRDEPFTRIIEEEVLFWWERHGLDYLAVTEPTITAFRKQGLPEQMQVSVKKRSGRRTRVRGHRHFGNTRSYREAWNEDDQAIYNFPALVFIVHGAADFHVGDYLIECPSNHFLFFRDNVPRPRGTRGHFVEDNVTQRQCGILWFFSPPGFNSVVSYVCHSEGSKHWSDGYHVVQHRNVIRAFEIFVDEVQEKGASWQRAVQSSFQTFLLLFLRELKDGRFLNTRPSQETVTDGSSIERAKAYIEAHFHLPLTTASVSDKVYMSRRSFVEHFRQETGQTFHEFLTEKRMERAQQLLSAGNWSIGAVAQRVGLKPTRFCTQFRSHFKITPADFRREQQKRAQKR